MLVRTGAPRAAMALREDLRPVCEYNVSDLELIRHIIDDLTRCIEVTHALELRSMINGRTVHGIRMIFHVERSDSDTSTVPSDAWDDIGRNESGDSRSDYSHDSVSTETVLPDTN